MKSQILEGLGLSSPQAFPITTEGMPLQMVAYLRLARLQDPAEFAKVRSAVPSFRRAQGRRTQPMMMSSVALLCASICFAT